MRIKLLTNIIDGAGNLKAVLRPGRKAVPFVEGAVIEVSEATGAKYIERGLAEECRPASPAAPAVPTE